MQIHFLWVKNFGRLQEAGINLSAKFIFEMQPTSRGNYNLIINENPDYIENFFGYKQIENVTAIIGKNGAGKTTILNYIKSHLPDGLEANIENDLFVYSVKDRNGPDNFVVIKPSNLIVNIVNNTKTKMEERTYGWDVGESLRFNGELGIPNYIYYAYHLDFNQDMTVWSGLTNISTSFLLTEERRRIHEENNDISIRQTLLADCNDLDNLHMSEVSKAIQLLKSENLNLPFEAPSFLNIEIDFNDILYFSSLKKNTSPNNLVNIHNKLVNLQRAIAEKKNVKEVFMDNFLLAILVNFLITDYRYSPNNPYYHPLEDWNGEIIKDHILSFFTSMETIDIRYKGSSVESKRHKELAQIVPIFFNHLEKLIYEGSITIRDQKNMSLIMNNQSDENFKAFTDLYLKIKGLTTFLKFRWRSLSSGEQSHLSLMSRFYHIRYHSISQLPKKMVILIDEGDTGYHPEWQRKFLNNTINFLCQLFDEDYSMQLIITANTPFLTSDLPNSNVVFIEKNDKSSNSVFHSKNNNRERTFAANIHTLLSNSFYMEGVLMGEFAKEKINSIIKYLKSKDNVEPREDYRKIIDMIGEPILRKKLKDMWMEKFSLDEELTILRARIEEIKFLKKEGKND